MSDIEILENICRGFSFSKTSNNRYLYFLPYSPHKIPQNNNLNAYHPTKNYRPPGAGVAEEIFPTQTGAPFLSRATGWIAKGVVFGARGEFMLWKQRPWPEKRVLLVGL